MGLFFTSSVPHMITIQIGFQFYGTINIDWVFNFIQNQLFDPFQSCVWTEENPFLFTITIARWFVLFENNWTAAITL